MTASDQILSIVAKSSTGDDFMVHNLIVEEALCQPYIMKALISTDNSSFDGDDLVSKGFGFTYNVFQENSPSSQQNSRNFHGVVDKLMHTHTVVNDQHKIQHFFEIELRPNFWLLTYSQDHRIFQNQTTIDIIHSVLTENNVSDLSVKASGGKNTREYCVQYSESHFHFVSRLLEEEGIGYYFTHTETSHTMVLFDKNADFSTAEPSSFNFLNNDSFGNTVNSIFAFGKKSGIQAKSYKTSDYNYETPNAKLLSSSSGDGKGFDVYQHPGLFQESGVGDKLADSRLEAYEWFEKRVWGKSTAPDLSPGFSFNLKDHPLSSYNKAYVVSKAKHEIIGNPELTNSENPELTYRHSFEGFLKDIPFKPLRLTKKPRIFGSQTAFVTGEGDEVYADEMARIKVQFHWDLLNPNDETSSLWVRVSQSLAGQTWGALYMPRVGMEVVVTFIDGDPDRPLVTGCVYNEAFMPPYSPKDDPQYMTIKSKTFEDASGFNEMRFSDDPGKEEIYTHAQYDMNTVIEHSRQEDINTGDDTLIIHEGNKTIHQMGSGTTYLTEIDNGDRTTKLSNGNLLFDVTGTITLKATSDITIQTPTNVIINAGQNVQVQGGQNIESQAGMNMTNMAGQNIESTAGMNIMGTAGQNVENTGGMNVVTTGGQNVATTAGENVATTAGMNVQLTAGMNLMASAGLNAQIQGGINVMLTGGVALVGQGAMITLKADGAAVIDGGAMAALKGAITAIG